MKPSDPAEEFADPPLPTHIKRWNLYGAGLDSLEEVTVPLPEYGPDELLVRHDACGICFSDIKIIAQGPNHVRLQGRDLKNDPVVMGHEVALTVAGVGDHLRNKFSMGQRFIMQADVYYHGTNPCYGYQLRGGMAQYGVVTREVLDGDEGCYLVPLEDKTGFAEGALVEPWACVVAAYEYPNYRDGLKEGGKLLVVEKPGQASADINSLVCKGHEPALVIRVKQGQDYTQIRTEQTQDSGFDDIVVYGTPSAEEIGRILTALGKQGIVNLVLDTPLTGTIPVDVGRVHYEQHLFVSSSSPSEASRAYKTNTRQDLKPGGRAWLVGAGGPMGQMQIQRAVMLESPPGRVVVSDRNQERLNRVESRFGALARERGIELILINVTHDAVSEGLGPFDDIVSMVPFPDALIDSIPLLAQDGVYNIFAGMSRGTMANLDLGTILAKNQRMIGTSGSSLADIKHTLELVETEKLSTNASLAAIGGLDAFREGLKGVQEGRFPGKTVIYPNIDGLPLLSLDDLREELPDVYAYVRDGQFWTNQAEQELLQHDFSG